MSGFRSFSYLVRHSAMGKLHDFVAIFMQYISSLRAWHLFLLAPVVGALVCIAVVLLWFGAPFELRLKSVR